MTERILSRPRFRPKESFVRKNIELISPRARNVEKRTNVVLGREAQRRPIYGTLSYEKFHRSEAATRVGGGPFGKVIEFLLRENNNARNLGGFK